jgi:hypothetical protein
MSNLRRQRSDVGTVLLHLVLLGAFVVALGTGLRIACDDPDAGWLAILDPILPSEHLWFRHLVAGVALAGALAGYAVYVRRARLTPRLRLDLARLKAIGRGGEARWAALGIIALWILLLGLAAEIVTGAAMFLVGGQVMTQIHLWVTWLCLACAITHVALHVARGGVQHALKIFRPSPLRVAPPPPDLAELLAEQMRKNAEPSDAPRPEATLRAHPLATAAAVGLVVTGLACGTEVATRTVLPVVAITKQQAPILDGDISDPAWSKARAVSVMTTQGGDFGGTHQTRIEVRALHDGERIYFAFLWDDPTRSLKHQPLIKTAEGWRVAASRSDLADEETYHEDKFAVLLAPPGLPLIGAAIHLATRPLRGKPGSSTGRGLHYTSSGAIVDVWQWRASHEGAHGHVDNCHFGGPQEPDDSMLAASYSGGFALDPGDAPHRANIAGVTLTGGVLPRRLPKDIGATARVMGRITDAANESESENARWWMTMADSVPFSSDRDAAIPVGTIIPGVIMADTQADEVVGYGRWAGGRWTLEVSRRLATGSAFDVEIRSGVLMWLAAFDHAHKRHSRHLRPLRLQLE